MTLHGKIKISGAKPLSLYYPSLFKPQPFLSFCLRVLKTLFLLSLSLSLTLYSPCSLDPLTPRCAEMNPTLGSTCPAVTARGREKINKEFSAEMPCPSFNFILDLPSSMQPFLLNSAAGVSMQFTRLLLLLTSRFSLLNALEWDCKLSVSDYVPTRHFGS